MLRRRFIAATAFAAVLLASATVTPGQDGTLHPLPGRPIVVQDAIDRSRALIGARQSEHRFPGIGAAVAVRGRIVWSEGFGWDDLDPCAGVGIALQDGASEGFLRAALQC